MNVTIIDGDLPENSDKVILPPEVLEATLEKYGDNLPHPLIFKLIKEITVFVGVKQFSAPHNTIILPKAISNKLNVIEDAQVNIELATDIAKGTYLKLKPLQFYQEINNWRYYLESNLTNMYTVLNKGQTLRLNEYELLVEDCNADVISIIDTDINLDIVPLNDIMANQQLNFNSDNAKIVTLGDLNIEEILPFNAVPAIQVYKLDLMDLSFDISVSILTKGDICNVDLLLGFEKLLNLENFQYCTMDQDVDEFKRIIIPFTVIKDVQAQCKYDLDLGLDDDSISKYLYIVPFTWEHTSNISINISQHFDSPKLGDTSPDGMNKMKCPNCRKLIDPNSFTVHQAFCFRNNIRCDCGKIISRQKPSNHWHCPICLSYSTIESNIFKFKHNKFYHQTFTCNCNPHIVYKDYISFIKDHKSTTCPNKLHECKFCHLILPQGETTYIDKYQNLTNHENLCGNKTDECYKCGKIIKRKDMGKHLQLHTLEMKQSNKRFKESFNKCSNENCINLVNSPNNLNLCDICYGPLYSSIIDEDNLKLQLRLERKYMLQLNKGCEYHNCQNQYCKRNKQFNGIQEIIKFINEDLLTQIGTPRLPINKSRKVSKNKFWFCVNETMNNKLLLWQGFQQYPPELVIQGLNEIRDINKDTLQGWLIAHT